MVVAYFVTFLIIAILVTVFGGGYVVWLYVRRDAVVDRVRSTSPLLRFFPDLQNFTSGHAHAFEIKKVFVPSVSDRFILYYLPTDIEKDDWGDVSDEDYPKVGSVVVSRSRYVSMGDGKVNEFWCLGLNDRLLSDSEVANNAFSKLAGRINALDVFGKNKQEEIERVKQISFSNAGGEMTKFDMDLFKENREEEWRAFLEKFLLTRR